MAPRAPAQHRAVGDVEIDADNDIIKARRAMEARFGR
jgi:hypothetical protein